MRSDDLENKPPKWADRFLEWYCSVNRIDEIQGDLYEAHYHRSNRIGAKKANLWFIWDVIRFFRPSSFGKQRHIPNPFDMHLNYLKISYRNFIKNKVYSSINLSGLVVGIVSCLFISLHVLEELSYDRFHPYPESTYRVVMDMFNKEELSAKSAPVYAAVGPNLVIDYPEIIESTRILPFGNGVYSVKRPDGSLVRYNEERAVYADENFFQIFGFPLIDGNPVKVLSERNQVVLSESTAKRYFGTENPIGKTITYRGFREGVVTGIMQDFPENSHMQFDIVSSLKSWDGFEEWPQNWGWYDFYTYIRTNDQADINALADKLNNYLETKKAESYENTGSREVLWLQNIADIHLYSKGLSWEMGENGGADKVYFLVIIAAMILIIAWVNFINLSTARSVKRAKEVGLRKVVGARKLSLISQFLTEAFVYNLSAVILSLIIVFVSVPIINGLIEVSLERTMLLSLNVIIGLIILIFLGTIVSGLYPAFVLTSFKPLNVLKGNFYNRRSQFGFRQILVIFQFTVSIILVLGTVTVVKQLKFMQSQDLGLDIAQTLVIRAPSSSRGGDDLINRNKVFAAKLEQLPEARGFTVSSVVPGVENFSISSFFTRFDPKLRRDCYRVRIDDKYFSEFGIDLVTGRNFRKELQSDSSSVILNKEAVKLFGFGSPDDAVGETLNPGLRYQWKIVGVVENYHHSSLKESLDPIIFYYHPTSGNFFSVKLENGKYQQIVSDIEEIWDEIYPDNPFDFFFLDEFFNRQYKSDQQFNVVFRGFAALAIIVACLGLFGLVSFTTEQGRKEIGIRKVLGASVMKIVLLFGRDYAVLITIAILIAFPLGYYLMNNWLQDFAYRTNIDPYIFVIGGLTVVVIAFLTVSFKSVSAARSNPVGALREE